MKNLNTVWLYASSNGKTWAGTEESGLPAFRLQLSGERKVVLVKLEDTLGPWALQVGEGREGWAAGSQATGLQPAARSPPARLCSPVVLFPPPSTFRLLPFLPSPPPCYLSPLPSALCPLPPGSLSYLVSRTSRTHGVHGLLPLFTHAP